MSKKTKNIAQAVAEVEATETITVATENFQEALVEATEEAEIGSAAEAVEEAVVEATEEAKKRVRGYAQTAISLEDHARLNAIKARWKESLNLTVSNAEIITAAIDCLSHEANLEAFMKQLVTANDDRQRNKDIKKLAELQAKLGITAEA